MDPNEWNNRQIDTRIDIYSFADCFGDIYLNVQAGLLLRCREARLANFMVILRYIDFEKKTVEVWEGKVFVKGIGFGMMSMEEMTDWNNEDEM